VIVCQTERLILRHFTEEDLEPLAVIHADPDVMRFFGGARTVAQTRARLFDFLSAYKRVGLSKWAVVLRNTGELIGRCGPAIEPIEGVEEVELGYDLAKRYWGQGLATEALARRWLIARRCSVGGALFHHRPEEHRLAARCAATRHARRARDSLARPQGPALLAIVAVDLGHALTITNPGP
jgi:RimJ/RimL family protein N-acetyltransferase